MIKILTLTGTRPQIIKSAALSRVINNHYHEEVEEVIVHTGQHYDVNLSEVFLKELGLPVPKHFLNIGSHFQGKQTGMMLEKIEEVVLLEKPSMVVLYGDTNTTLAGALAASKLRIPIAHIEAGLRSFNKKMPEELNRIVCDHTSTLLFAPTGKAIENLNKEGFDPNSLPPYSIDNPAVIHSGDIMLDNSLYFADIANKRSSILNDNHLSPGSYILFTVHRDHNTDDPVNLKNILNILIKITAKYKIPVFFPVHPRTLKMIDQLTDREINQNIKNNSHLILHSPVSFFDMIRLESNAQIIMTDSGGVQKEAYFFRKPVIVLREETEWVEIIDKKAGILAGTDPARVLDAFEYFHENPPGEFPEIFGDGNAAAKIINNIIDCL